MSLLKLAASSNPVLSSKAEAVDFDGTNDYLSRSSDLIGNADGKTFTFSCWFDRTSTSGNLFFYQSGATAYFYVLFSSTDVFVVGLNTSGANILQGSFPFTRQSSIFTNHNIIISIDMASSTMRSIYMDDIAQTVTWTTYTNDVINFKNTYHSIHASNTSVSSASRLAHVFLAYEYIDLSIEANRRIFITSDRRPA